MFGPGKKKDLAKSSNKGSARALSGSSESDDEKVSTSPPAGIYILLSISETLFAIFDLIRKYY